MKRSRKTNMLGATKKYNRILFYGAIYVGLCVLFAGGVLRSLMVKEVASQMGSRMADLYSSAETQRMRNISQSLIHEARDLALLDPTEPAKILRTLEASAMEIEEQNQYTGVEVFAEVDGVFFSTNPQLTQETVVPWIDSALRSSDQVHFLSLAAFDAETVVPVVYADGNDVIGYVVEPEQISNIVSLDTMLERSMFLLCDTRFQEVLCQSNAGSCAGPVLLNGEELQGLKSLNEQLVTNQNGLRSTIVKKDGEDYHIYFSTLDNGYTCVLLFPQSALLEKCRSWWILYYLWVVVLLIILGLVAVRYSRKNNLNRTGRILLSLTESFEAGYFIDFKQQRFDVIKKNEEIQTGSNNDFDTLDLLWAQFLMRSVKEKYRDSLDKMFDVRQLSAHMEERGVLSMDFEHPEKGWCRLICTPVDKEENGEVQSVLVTLSMIDAQKQMELELKRENEDLQEVVMATAKMFDRFFIVDLEQDTYEYSYVKGVNTRIDRPGKDGTVEEFESDCKDRFYQPDSNKVLNRPFTAAGIREILKNRDDFYMEYRDSKFPDQYLSTTLFCIERKEGIPSKVVYAVRDIAENKQTEQQYKSQLKEANEKLTELANHDVLTGLYNRRGLMETVSTGHYERKKAAVILLDVDKFKLVNDNYGHQVGDLVLQEVADGLKHLFRSGDILVRLGGDEFMVLLMDCDRSHADMIRNKMHMLNVALSKPEPGLPVVSVSAGVAFSRPGESEILYRRADDALYKVKENGRGGCMIHELDLEETGEE